MGALDRALLFLFSAAVAVLAILTGAQALQLRWAAGLFSHYQLQFLVGSIILFLVALRFLLFRAGAVKEPQSIVHRTEHGDVQISLQTLESLADRAARLVRGVSELKTRVRPAEAGVRIGIRVVVDPDLDIPQITTSVQQKVKDYVESTAGITVQNVVVYVTDISRPQAGKLPARARVE